jgi:ankyrin repeat protein
MISPALQALYRGEPEQARELLRPDDELPAYEAAAFGRVERLARLLDEDPANATDWSPDGFTALHLAIFGESAEAVRLLIDHGADLEAVSAAEIAQVTPLGTAAFVRSTALARLLLEAGADPATGLGGARENGDEAFEALLREFGAS